jgi:preprotein translocase subunit YajC
MQTLIFLQGGGGNGGMFNLLFFGLIIAVFWLFIIRPQSKRQKEQTRFGSTLEKGKDVVTASGMLGKINKIEGDVITLEVGTKTFIKVMKSAISKEMTDSLYGKDGKDGKGAIIEKAS